MQPIENPAPGATGDGASEKIKFATTDTPKNTTLTNKKQDEDRFCHSASLHFACARVIQNLARQYAISTSHAATVADLSGIGGRRA